MTAPSATAKEAYNYSSTTLSKSPIQEQDTTRAKETLQTGKADLETLKSQGLQLPSVTDQGQSGQRRGFKLHNTQLGSLNSSFNKNKAGAGSSVVLF